MKSITIHNIDNETSRLIEKKSKESGLSLNKTIKLLLHKALGVSNKEIDNRTSFEEFYGIWNDEQFQEFERATSDLNKVNTEDWK